MKEVTLRLTYLGLLVAGAVSLAWVAYTYVDARIFQTYYNWELDRELAAAQAAAPEPISQDAPGQSPATAVPPQDPSPTPAAASAPPRGEEAQPGSSPREESSPPDAASSSRLDASIPVVGEPMGRMEIKRIGLSAVVLYGDDTKTLRRGVGHVIGTALPGMDGNMALSAHRDTFFRPLRNIRKNDRVVLKTPQGNYEYEVESTMVVKPTQVEVLDPTPDPMLTLITCHPFNYVGSAPNRFIVRARRVNPAAEEASAKAPATEEQAEGSTAGLAAAGASTAGTN
jgi:sortase A